MTNEEKARKYVSALTDRDHWEAAATEARIRFEEAQSLCWELELQLFESSTTTIQVEEVAEDEDFRTTRARILDAFARPRRVPDVAKELDLMVFNVRAQVAALYRKGKLRRKARGVYVTRKDV